MAGRIRVKMQVDRGGPPPAWVGDGHDDAPPPFPTALIRCGAELVELSERFYRGMFVGCVIFVGFAGVAALALLPLRQSDATYGTITVVLTGLLVAVIPIAVLRVDALYRLLRSSEPTQFALVLLAAALVVYPLRSELWWPSCALLMLLATLVPLRRALAYCFVVLLANLAAHATAGDLTETPPVTIIGLWVGYVFWSAAFSIFNDRLAAHVLRLNTVAPRRTTPPLRVDVGQGPAVRPNASADQSDASRPDLSVPGDSPPLAGDKTRRLTARQLQVVALLSDGMRYDEVAACLAISVRQVQRHVTNAITRLGLHNANELVAAAMADGLVPNTTKGSAAPCAPQTLR
jgi:DNA-binding CsgD family transcriptional regulator